VAIAAGVAGGDVNVTVAVVLQVRSIRSHSVIDDQVTSSVLRNGRVLSERANRVGGAIGDADIQTGVTQTDTDVADSRRLIVVHEGPVIDRVVSDLGDRGGRAVAQTLSVTRGDGDRTIAVGRSVELVARHNVISVEVTSASFRDLSRLRRR